MNGLEERGLESGVEYLKDGLDKVCTHLVAVSRDSESPPDYRNFSSLKDIYASPMGSDPSLARRLVCSSSHREPEDIIDLLAFYWYQSY